MNSILLEIHMKMITKESFKLFILSKLTYRIALNQIVFAKNKI